MSSIEAQVSELKGAYRHLATKADVESLRADMNERFASVNERLGSLESRLLRWMVGMTLTFIIALASVVLAIINGLSGAV